MPASSEATVTLTGDLHARPAGALSMAAARYAAEIVLVAGGREANAKSVLAVMQLGASSGQPVTVRAAGADAAAAVAAVTEALTAATKVGD
ncbi:MAG TPA: HPr family phosphocarrier protein [Trebonia sp.]|jgi:phosphotransferase system HPr (HPr) family protein|nr:HPr family phosphocarrier protein [Trebonia sp.]